MCRLVAARSSWAVVLQEVECVVWLRRGPLWGRKRDGGFQLQKANLHACYLPTTTLTTFLSLSVRGR